jgi:hypothetical protein
MQGSCFVRLLAVSPAGYLELSRVSKHRNIHIEFRKRKHSRRSAHVDHLALPVVPNPFLNDTSRWSFPLRGEEVVARCSLAPQAVSAARPTAGNKGLGTNHRRLDQLPSCQYPLATSSSRRIGRAFAGANLVQPSSSAEGPGDFSSADNPYEYRVLSRKSPLNILLDLHPPDQL